MKEYGISPWAMPWARGPQALTAITAVGGEAPHLSDNYEPVVIK